MNKNVVLFLLLNFTGFGLVSFLPSFIPSLGNSGSLLLRGFTVLIAIYLIFQFIYKPKYLINKYNLFLVIILTFYCLRLIYDVTFSQLPFARTSSEIIFIAIGTMYLPVLACCLLSFSDRSIIYFVRAMIILNTLVCLGALSNGLIYGFNYRLSGNDVLNPISLGHISVTSIIAIAYMSLIVGNVSKRQMNLYIISLVICLITLIFANSRGPYLSLILSLVCLFIYSKSGYKKTIVWLFLFGVFGGLGTYVTSLSGNLSLNRFTINLGDGNSESGEQRVQLWSYAIDSFVNNPLFGSATTTKLGYVHNILLEIVMSLGITGGMVFTMILWTSFKTGKYLLRGNEAQSIFALLFIQYFIGAMFSGTVYSNGLMFISCALLLNTSLSHNSK